jgi:adenosylhomocysteine nucleosidase
VIRPIRLCLIGSLIAAAASGQSTSRPSAPVLLQGAVSSETDVLLDSVRVTRVDTIGAWTFAHGSIDEMPVIVSRTMMGATHAAAATAIAIERYHPRAIINAGTAGGHDAKLHNGDIIVGTVAVYVGAFQTPRRNAGRGSNSLDWMSLDLSPRPSDKRDTDMHPGDALGIPGDSALIAAAHRAAERFNASRVKDGIIGSADMWNEELDRITQLHHKWGTSVEEMETAPAAIVARGFGIPFVGIRVVSDNAITGEQFDRRTGETVQQFVLRVVHSYLRAK